MFAHFFIERPIFASVLSIVLTLVGAVALVTLPVAQYPEIAPPTVQVFCIYPGANARVVSETVAAPIEQQVNGVERMLYMSSQCTNDGAYNLTVTFELGTDLDMAQVLVQNRVSLAMPVLPPEVQQSGVSTKKKSPNIMLVVNLISPDGRYDQLYMSNYATIQIKDELARLYGVGDVSFLGQKDYSMRVWLDPNKLAARSLTTTDVVAALRAQNVQVAAGQIGRPPVPEGQVFQYTMSTLGRLIEPEQFASIIVKTGEAGQVTRLGDVGRIELGALSEDVTCTLDGEPSVGLAVFQLPGSNALETAELVKAKMDELAERFPTGLAYDIVYDTTPFIEESIAEVFKALRDATILVGIVVLIFLQGWRATVIPLVAVPVSIIGTFIAMAALGFSLNNLSLFGLVLAIGIVVDDAIVVVEAVEHHIAQGLRPKEATRKALTEVSGPVIATSLALCAVFIPSAFITGITGQFFRQFALTIAVSTVISSFNSLTLSPALCALLLRPRHEQRDLASRLLDRALGWFFGLFNAGFDRATTAYGWTVGRLLRGSLVVLVVYAGMLYLTYESFQRAPTGFIPNQDKGYLLVTVQLPDSASLERTQQVLARMERMALETEGVAHTVGVAGQSFLLNANASNFASMFAVLEPFHHRRDVGLRADAIGARLTRQFRREIIEAQVAVFGAPPVDGLGNAGGFKLMVQDRGDVGLATLEGQTERLIEVGNEQPALAGMFSMFRANTPQLYVDIDRTKCLRMGVPLDDVFSALQVYLGGFYVNDFNRFGRTWQVNLQGDAVFRARPEDVGQLRVRNARGDMVPLGTLVEIREVGGPVVLPRYNMYPAAPVNGATAPGVSTGQGLALVEELARRELPAGFSFEWTELSFLQVTAGSTAMLAFVGAAVLVFLVLAAQYESWTLPLAVILVVPMCLLFSIVGIVAVGFDVNIFTQIGFVVLVGLASKNAILIVEFAQLRRDAGANLFDATVEACRLRLRPIMMTSLSFILGVVPLVIASGAGAEMRRTLGTAVFSGMLGVTMFGIFLTPVFYFTIGWLTSRRDDRGEPARAGQGDDDVTAAAASDESDSNAD